MDRNIQDLLTEARGLFDKRDYAGVVKTVGVALGPGDCEPGFARILVLSYNAVGRHDLALQWSEEALRENAGDTEISDLVRAINKVLEPGKPKGKEKSPWATGLPADTMLQIQSGLHRMKYRGIPIQKNPFDLAIYLQLLWDLQPGTIFEIGTHSGGAAVWFGDQLVNYGLPGRVISIDLLKPPRLEHSRVTFLEGDATNLGQPIGPDLLTASPHPWLVTEDSSHEIATSEGAWRFFHPHLIPGDYLVIEDGIISDLFPETYPHYSSGPHIAIRRLLAEFPDRYKVDRHYCDFFGHNFTWCTNGFIRRL